MIIAELPIDEELRLIDLASYEVLDTAPEEDFNDLVELAADICNCPISTISLIDEGRQWFKARHGIEKTGTSRDIAFCSHTILQNDVMMVENATTDERFFDNPLVTGEDDNIRFYAGAPIVTKGGYKVGTVCVIDHTPKKLSEKQQKALTTLSNQVSKLLELRKKNILIRKRAAEIIAIKSSTIETVIEKQETEKNDIAYNLHEDIAQRLSSIRLYLKMSKEKESGNTECMDMAEEQLKETLGLVRNMSYNITPYKAEWLPAEALIEEFVEKTANTFPFNIELNIAENETKEPAENTICAIRLIELWLQFISYQKNATQVIITVQSIDELEITILDNGIMDFEKQEKYILESSMYERATACKGTLDLSILVNDNSALKIVLPHNQNSNSAIATKQNLHSLHPIGDISLS